MNKKISVSEATPKKQKRSGAIKKTSIIEKEEKNEDEVLPDDEENLESEPDIDLELAEKPEAIETEEEIDGEELSDLLDVIEQEESIDEVIDLIKDEDDTEDDSEDIQKLLKYSADNSKKVAAAVVLGTDEDDTADEVVEEVEQKPKSRWLITTCRYCGDMYRFRSDQIQPATCGRPKCLSRYEEISRKKAALIS